MTDLIKDKQLTNLTYFVSFKNLSYPGCIPNPYSPVIFMDNILDSILSIIIGKNRVQ
jgi:hypothetical protein